MEGKRFSDIHLQRRDNIKSLATVFKSVKVKDQHLTINPNQLFHRIVCVSKSRDDLASYLKYELAAKPPSLFDEYSVRKGTKSTLTLVIEAMVTCENIPPPRAVYAVDGGYLLHHVIWQRPATFSQICAHYTSFIISKFGEAHIVFDGYNMHSTKDEEHIRRRHAQLSRDVVVENHKVVPVSQQEFLANGNKKALIRLLTIHLETAGCKVYQAEADADRLIVSTAISLYESERESIIVGEDADILVLLIALANPLTDIKIMNPANKFHPHKVYSSKCIQMAMGDMKNNLLFLHAMTGCDTTSAFYRKGKKLPFKKLKEDVELQHIVQVFNDSQACTEDIAAAGEAFILVMYGGRMNSNLDECRYHTVLRTIAKQPAHARFELATLPPTSAPALQHSYRIFPQVQQWRGVDMNPTDWGGN